MRWIITAVTGTHAPTSNQGAVLTRDNSLALTENPNKRPTARRSKWGEVRLLLPGALMTCALAALALALMQWPLLGILSPMFIAIVLGMIMRNTIGIPKVAQPGVTFTLKKILRLSLIPLGLQVTMEQVGDIGFAGAATVAISLLGTLAITIWLGNRLGIARRLTILLAVGTSVCGASAIVAANTVTDAPDEDVAYAITCVTAFGTIAMFLYPLLAGILALDSMTYGLWAGASIHETAQVIAAGFQHGQEAGEVATIAKLTRVILLAPLVLVLAVAYPLLDHSNEYADKRTVPTIPWFVLGFMGMIALNNLIAIPPDMKNWVLQGTMFALSASLAGLGLETGLREIKAKGFRPVALALFGSIFIAVCSFLLINVLL